MALICQCLVINSTTFSIRTLCAHFWLQCRAVMPNTKLQEHTGSEKAWVWSAVDYADEVQKPELFCIRFASVESKLLPMKWSLFSVRELNFSVSGLKDSQGQQFASLILPLIFQLHSSKLLAVFSASEAAFFQDMLLCPWSYGKIEDKLALFMKFCWEIKGQACFWEIPLWISIGFQSDTLSLIAFLFSTQCILDLMLMCRSPRIQKGLWERSQQEHRAPGRYPWRHKSKRRWHRSQDWACD